MRLKRGGEVMLNMAIDPYRSQLTTITKHIHQLTGRSNLVAIADRGYFIGTEIL